MSLEGALVATPLEGALGIQGLVGGWMREIKANDANPALTIGQAGAGKIVRLLQGATERAYFNNDGHLYLDINNATRAIYIAQSGSGWAIECEGVSYFRGQTVNHAAFRCYSRAGQVEELATFYAPSSWGTNPMGLFAWVDTDGSTKRTLFDTEGLLKVRHFASLPTAAAAYRSKLAVVEGGTGVLDAFYICRKLANDSYAWKEVTVAA